MGLAGCWSAGAGAINNNPLLYVPPSILLPLLAVLVLLALSLFPSPAYSIDQLHSKGAERSSAELHNSDRIYSCRSHSGNCPPGPFELASASKLRWKSSCVGRRQDGGLDGGGGSKLRVAGQQLSGVGGFGQGIREINDGVSLCGMRQDERR